MKYILLVCLLLAGGTTVWGQERQEIFFEKDWKFSRGDVSGAREAVFDDSRWETVCVPHDWAIAGPFDRAIDLQTVAIEQNGEKVATEKTGRTGALPYTGVGWYRRTFASPAAGMRTTLVFDGAMSEPRVYVNGREAGRWANGYNSFYIDVTPFLRPAGEANTLAVRLENQPQSSRWYSGAGLYRPVRMQVAGPVAVDTWGVFVTTPKVDSAAALVRVQAEVTVAGRKDVQMDIALIDGAGQVVARKEAQPVFSDGTVDVTLEVSAPRLWSPETPALYKAVVKVLENGKIKDEYTVRFGIRSVGISPDKGFVLNGVPRKFKGVCLHHDLGPLGAALNKAALRRQLRILKDMGCDAIRTSHNMPSPWQMELCDEMGLMVMAESFDEWKYPKCKNGYNRFYDEWMEKDLVNLIRCHRNHPSVVMWCVGNEIPEQGSASGARMARRMQDICHREDPTRAVTSGMDRVDAAVKSGFAGVFDVVGLNYRTHKYEGAWKALPQGLILGSETASTVSSRGVYKFPVEEVKNKVYPDNQCSSYDVEACSWSNIPEDDWMLQDDKPWVMGEFVWTGFDYLGEPTPYDEQWPSRSSYFGICDLAGLPKDRFYLYRSRWNREARTLHLLPHWTWPGRKGEVTPVYCYTDYPSAELFVNGRSQGRKAKNAAVREDRYRLRWNDVRYEAGELKVVAYDEAGNVAASQVVRTAGKPHHLVLEADRTVLAAGAADLAFVTVKVVDKEGNLCPAASDLLRFKVGGSGSFRAACNGNAASLEPFVVPRMKVFGGMLVVVVEAGGVPGPVSLTVSGLGLKDGKLGLSVE